MPMPHSNSVFAAFGTTIFTVMSALAREHQAINLGQGFPDEDGPESVRAVAAEWLRSGNNQYPPMLGLPELRAAVAAHDARAYGLAVDWETEVMITSGATEAIADCCLGLIDPGDEVVLFEPLYDAYEPMVRRAGGIPRLVRLEPPEWRLPLDALASAFSRRTRLVILNSPLNPAGKVFEESELLAIGRLIIDHDVYAVCDEVYEHLVFDGGRHRPLITLPGLRDRCLRIGSAGKTLSMTGWKVGYVVAAAPLLAAVAKAHQFVTFTTPPNLQAAVAYAFEHERGYIEGLAAEQQRRRDRLAAGLGAAGLRVLPSAGSYFLVADIRGVGWTAGDDAFCRWLTTEVGVTAIPLSAFYCRGEERPVPSDYVRFCFCKRDEVLDLAIERLRAYFGSA
jgi:aspartate/methionine/tyrosine aminotransferase